MDMIEVGPAGEVRRYGTTSWDAKGRGELAQIFVSYDHNSVYSLQFLFYKNGKLVSEKHGFDDGRHVNFDSVILDYPSEFLTSISGSFHSITNGAALSSITFGTNKASYGPFGDPSSTSTKHFNFQIGNQFSFGGFHGSVRQLHPVTLKMDDLELFTHTGRARANLKFKTSDLQCRSPHFFLLSKITPLFSLKLLLLALKNSAVVLSQRRSLSNCCIFLQDSVFVFYENDKLAMSNKHGIDECENFCAVAFDYPTEFLTSISGSFRIHGHTSILDSISFGTNKGSYGPFGTPSIYSNKFTIQIGNYRSFGGFHGSTNSYSIGSIGIYMKPITISMINFKDLSVKFLFYENGKLVSEKHGSDDGRHVNFDSAILDYPSEFLTSLSGSFHSFTNGAALSSITFGTNKTSYGPFGDPSSTSTKYFQLSDRKSIFFWWISWQLKVWIY
ncbi:putative AT-rich interactive domain-containing protein 2-like isoform X1 [Capsicum annuum]|nr:putative AT-rich interactive domain-containing protein 2-like isoform X1 [Capsicum annuum]